MTLGNGERVLIKRAERGVRINSRPQERLWVRQVRKLTTSGHQTSLISTAYGSDALQDAGVLFSRWSQEDFFQYAMQDYGIDLQYAEYAAQTLHPEADAKKVEQWQQRQAALVEAIEHLEHELSEVKQLQSQTPKHLAWEDLPEEAQFQQLAPSRKRLLDHLTAAEMTCPGTNLKLAYSLFGPNP